MFQAPSQFEFGNVAQVSLLWANEEFVLNPHFEDQDQAEACYSCLNKF